MSVSPAKKSHEGLSARSGGIKMLTGTRVQNEKKKKNAIRSAMNLNCRIKE